VPTRIGQGRRVRARTGGSEGFARASRSDHGASVPPAMVAGRRVQAVVPRRRGSAAGGPGVVPQRSAGRSGRMRGAFAVVPLSVPVMALGLPAGGRRLRCTCLARLMHGASEAETVRRGTAPGHYALICRVV